MKKVTALMQLALCSAALTLAMTSHAQNVNTKAGSTGTTIVQSFEPAPGKNAADVYKAMTNIASTIRKMPGLIDDVVLENKSPEGKPSHMHVMRWKEQKDWEAMFANPEFQKALRDNVGYFRADAAGIFTPVK